MTSFARSSHLLLGMASATALALASAQPALAGDASPHVKHVLVLSFDGLHAIDLANYIKRNPSSGFAELASHDTNVGLLVSIPGLPGGVLKEAVDTRQVAPTILRSLGVNPQELEAVQREKSTALPGLSSIFQ